MNALPEYIKPGAFVLLKNGDKGRIYATDGTINTELHGARWSKLCECWIVATWAAVDLKNPFDTDWDIVGPWVDEPEVPMGFWENMPGWMHWAAYSREPYQQQWGLKWVIDGAPDAFGEWVAIPKAHTPRFAGDWKDSLIQRPSK